MDCIIHSKNPQLRNLIQPKQPVGFPINEYRFVKTGSVWWFLMLTKKLTNYLKKTCFLSKQDRIHKKRIPQCTKMRIRIRHQ